MEYLPTIGLEIHAELKTRTKMFCDSKNDPDESRPNSNICPVCVGHPGTLPVVNKEAVKHVIKVGLAVGGKIADFSEFDRKNYFYPDIPKGYQISQYKHPLVQGGELVGIKITRVHLEEDTATSLHEEGGLSVEKGFSLVDFNRAGVPLMELVTEPVIHSAKEAGDFARELQLLLRYLGVSDANMEKGEMRVEANISVSPKSSKELGTKVEVKNLNSFRAVEKAVAYEIERHVQLLEEGGLITQETRGWDDSKQTTFSQRTKEDSHDYRYFPDPDIPKLKISEIEEFLPENLTLPELPAQKRERYTNAFGISPAVCEIFIENRALSGFLEKVADILKDKESILLAINYLTSDLVGLSKDSKEGDSVFGNLKFSATEFATLIKMIRDGELSSRAAKDILQIMYLEGGSPQKIAEAKGLMQKNDEGELRKIIEGILESNAKVVADYKNGKESALQFLVGQGMKLTKGAANPELLKTLIKSILG